MKSVVFRREFDKHLSEVHKVLIIHLPNYDNFCRILKILLLKLEGWPNNFSESTDFHGLVATGGIVCKAVTAPAAAPRRLRVRPARAAPVVVSLRGLPTRAVPTRPGLYVRSKCSSCRTRSTPYSY